MPSWNIISHDFPLSLFAPLPLPPSGHFIPLVPPSASSHNSYVLRTSVWTPFQRRRDILKTAGVRGDLPGRNVKCGEQTSIQTEIGDHSAGLGCCMAQARPPHGVWGQGLQWGCDLPVSGSSVAFSKVTLLTVDSCNTPHPMLFTKLCYVFTCRHSSIPPRWFPSLLMGPSLASFLAYTQPVSHHLSPWCPGYSCLLQE